MACGEYGPGRMAEPLEIVAAIEAALARRAADGAAGARDLGPDARADRPGALHRQPLLGRAGHGDRRGRWRRWAREVTFVTGPGARAAARRA